jgi:hypothetical protein
LPNLARGVANRADSASWDKSPQTTFSFICCHLLYLCHCFPRFTDVIFNLKYTARDGGESDVEVPLRS